MSRHSRIHLRSRSRSRSPRHQVTLRPASCRPSWQGDQLDLSSANWTMFRFVCTTRPTKTRQKQGRKCRFTSSFPKGSHLILSDASARKCRSFPKGSLLFLFSFPKRSFCFPKGSLLFLSDASAFSITTEDAFQKEALAATVAVAVAVTVAVAVAGS